MLRPLNDNVVLKKEEQELKTSSGIILSESKSEPSVGKVLAVGPGRLDHGKLIEPAVKVGDRVVYKKYGTTEVEIDKEEYLVISEKDILAVVE